MYKPTNALLETTLRHDKHNKAIVNSSCKMMNSNDETKSEISSFSITNRHLYHVVF